MFTSDGFLIGAYRVPPINASQWQEIAKIEKQQGWVTWKPMAYCSGSCCGTYMVQKLNLSIQSSQLAQVAEQPVMEVPDPGRSAPVVLAELTPTSTCTFVLSPVVLSSFQWDWGYNASMLVINSTKLLNCPQRCKVGCCALVSTHQSKDSRELSVEWGDSLDPGLHQCNRALCEDCGFDATSVASTNVQDRLQPVWRLCAARKGPCKSKQPQSTTKCDLC